MSSFADRLRVGLAGAALLLAAVTAHSAATIVIVNGDPAGLGFNDPTPAAPVGGNPGSTLGQQRLNAFQHAASIWGATLSSNVTIRVLATWEALSCTANSAVLGSAGAISVFRDFAGAPRPGTWYPKALANKIFGMELDASTNDIRARFNINLGNANCLAGSPFYLGLDNNHGSAIDLVAVLLHELGHGLGFQTFTSGSTGGQLAGFPSVWDHYLTDATSGKNWVQMTAAERVSSAISVDKLVWNGPLVTATAPGVLSGLPIATISGPAAGSAAGDKLVGTASFGPAYGSSPVSGQVMPAIEANGNRLGCNPYTAAMKLAVNGKIALVDRGVCAFTIKVKNAQDAGATAVIIADNVQESPPPALGGSDPSISIQSVRITQSDGEALRAQLVTRSRTSSGVLASFGFSASLLAGTDSLGRLKMFAPNPFQAGSSVSHFDSTAFRNLLMEPSINADLLHAIAPPFDLTFTLFKEIGW